VWPTVLLGVCVLAIWRGRDQERLAAGGYLAAWALTVLVFKARSSDTQWAVLVIDLGLLGLFLWLAMRSGRFWPLFAAGFQLLAVVTHMARALDDEVSGWAYLTAGLVWGYLGLAAIGYGAWTAPYQAVTTDEPSDAPGATRR
jgi:hypothetical protein